ncbi:phosphatidylinositol-specific phospholipase C [Vibrio azureus]|nr:phosphatidylinositol-specific phospholipase C [Vibrio azureus]
MPFQEAVFSETTLANKEAGQTMRSSIITSIKLITLCLFSVFSQAHDDGSYLHDTQNPIWYSDWMQSIDDRVLIREMSIPGTHNSASFLGGDIVITQTLPIDEQLRSGIRFLDIRLRQVENVLAVHHGSVFQQRMFGNVLNHVRDFLIEHPTETVLMRVRNEYRGDNNNERFDETFLRYVNRYRALFWAGDNESPSLGEVRGKLVILQNFASLPEHRTGLLYNSFKIQDAWKIDSNWALYSKWEKIKFHFDWAQEQLTQGKNKGSINYLSASVGSFPYFVASGHSTPDTDGDRLFTGVLTSDDTIFTDFPRLWCMGIFCVIGFEGTNTLAANYIEGNNITFAGIVAADFPGPKLISSIIALNYAP